VSFAAGANYAGEANAEILAFAMIETQEAFDNAEAIAATPGLDGLYIGPADLTFSLAGGRLTPAFDRAEEEMIGAIKRILAAAKGAGIKAALHCGTADYAARAIGWGFDMTTVSGDSRLLAGAAAASVKRFRELTGGAAGAGETGRY
jgi:4-hydroxy-2-oxoheptanedioate aldolase